MHSVYTRYFWPYVYIHCIYNIHASGQPYARLRSLSELWSTQAQTHHRTLATMSLLPHTLLHSCTFVASRICSMLYVHPSIHTPLHPPSLHTYISTHTHARTHTHTHTHTPCLSQCCPCVCHHIVAIENEAISLVRLLHIFQTLGSCVYACECVYT